MKKYLLLLVLISAVSCTKMTPEKQIARIFNYFDKNTSAVSTLETVCNNYPARMSGSQNNSDAIDYFTLVLGKYVKPDNLWTQDVTVPNWNPGETKVTCIPSKGEPFNLNSVPLGLSIGTDGQTITADVVEVSSREDFDKAAIKDKIVFFNEAMSDENGYGKAGWQRRQGAAMAAKRGAVGVIVRSLTKLTNDDPHTGVTNYEDSVKQIPAIAISTMGADKLSAELKNDNRMKVSISSTSKRLPDAIGRNLVAEFTGREHPEHIILLSAHIDCWFNSQGAQDNAASCVAAIETLRAFKKLGIKPKNTIRIVLYQDEETGLAGMKEYAKIAKEKDEQYLFNMEMDSGAGGPKTFMVSEPEGFYIKMKDIVNQYLSSYGVEEIQSLKGGRANWPLTEKVHAPFYLYRSNTEKYFDIHHSSSDNFDKVDQAAFKKGIAAITSFVYLMD